MNLSVNYHLGKALSIYRRHLSKLRKADELRGFVFPFPKEKLQISTLRSSGPGGQNVNKRETKVQIKLNVQDADWISNRTKISLHRKLDKSGNLIVYDESSRRQESNKAACLSKIHQILVEHSYVAPEPSPEELADKELKQMLQKERWKKQQKAKKYFRNRDGPWKG